MAAAQWNDVMNDGDRTRAVIDFVKELADEQNFRATVRGSLVGGLVVGATAVGASLLLGPIGLFVGGTAGGLLGYNIAKDTYKPLSVVIQEMAPQKKRRLRVHIETIMANLDVRDVMALVAIMASDTTIKTKVASSIISFLAKEAGIHVLR